VFKAILVALGTCVSVLPPTVRFPAVKLPVLEGNVITWNAFPVWGTNELVVKALIVPASVAVPPMLRMPNCPAPVPLMKKFADPVNVWT